MLRRQQGGSTTSDLEGDKNGYRHHHGNQQRIGLATAVTLARAGHDVFATMRKPDGAPELQTISSPS